MGFAGSSSGTQHVEEQPGGAEKGDVVVKGIVWDRYGCLVVEETPEKEDDKWCHVAFGANHEQDLPSADDRLV